MFTRIIISGITLILSVATIFYFHYFIVLITRPISSGISGVGFAVSIFFLLYALPITAILNTVLLAVLTYRGWIPLPLGIGAICVFCLLAIIVILSPIFAPIFSK